MLIAVLTSTLFAKWHPMLIAAKLDTRSPPMVFFRQWLFRRRRQFALGIYFAVIIHVCLYS